MGLVVTAAAAVDDLPRFDAGALLSEWGLAPLPLVVTVWAVGLYVLGVLTLRRRGDAWPVGRSIAWGVGMLAFYLATSSGLAAYDTQMIKETYAENAGIEENNKLAVFGALSLYLSFINLFQMLLQLFGAREE